MKLELTSISMLIVFTVCILVWDACRTRDPEREIPFEIATATVERLKDWSTWQTGMVTAAIAAMGFLVQRPNLRPGQRRWAFFTILFLGSSLLLAVWLVSLLPGVLLQLSKETVTDNDIYRHAFSTCTGVQLPALVVLQHIYFVLGIVCFAVMIYLIFPYEAPKQVA